MKKKAYIIGVSGGPDSMALLHILRKKYTLICAHVNYHFREEAEQESALVAKYCLENNISFRRYDCYYKGGNFEDWARKERYQFYASLAQETGIKQVLLAHHLDDHIETYLLQKFKGINVSYWGLKPVRAFKNYTVLRPLLNYTKANLLAYCKRNSLPYAIDKSNFDCHYTRNRLRVILNNLSDCDKYKIVKKIASLNKEKANILALCKTFLNNKKSISVATFLSFKYPEECLRLLTYQDLSKKEALNYLNLIKNNKQVKCLIRDKVLAINYGYLEVYQQVKPFSYTFNSLKELKKCSRFSFSEEGQNKEALRISCEDFPLTFRNVRDGDYIRLKFGRKKLSRYFIDAKIPYSKRDKTFVVTNNKGNIIFVSGLGSSLEVSDKEPCIYCISSNFF